MNAKTIAVLVFFAFIASSMAGLFGRGHPQVNCGPNEVFNTCGYCEGNCARPIPACTRECKPAGCYCPPDFVRAENGDCVHIAKCAVPLNGDV
uniref:TIL domain-containing protein n=1 Tax=Panagrellus redivivus TaxID=6233 RepID=A0A7E4V8V0_PANRE